MSHRKPIDVFCGQVTESLARVYAACRDLPGGGEWSLHGTLRGPVCHGVRTLPLSVPLRDLGAGPSLLAAAALPDPSFWTPEVPARYEVQLELRRGSEVVQRAQQWLGLRQLGPVGRFLRCAGRRWVVRGVAVDGATADDLAAARDSRAVLFVREPADDLLMAAAEQGVWLAVEIDATEPHAELRRVARCPAVAVASFQDEHIDAAAARAAAPNLLLAQRVEAAAATTSAAWAELVLVEGADASDFAGWAAAPLPVVAVRRLNEPRAISTARADCDQLQRELAPHGDIAGYVIRVDRLST